MFVSPRLLQLTVFAAGFASLGVELAASRLLAPFFGTSLLVWANLIGVILIYLSLGYWLGGRWADHVGGMIPATIGLALQALALVVLTFLTPTTPYLLLALALGLMGLGGALFWSPNTSTTMGAAPRNRLGVASATFNTLRNVGMVCSFAVALAVAAASMPPALVNEVFLGTVSHLQMAIALAFTNAILGATHAMSHQVGGLLDLPHGVVNGVLLPHVIRFNADGDA